MVGLVSDISQFMLISIWLPLLVVLVCCLLFLSFVHPHQEAAWTPLLSLAMNIFESKISRKHSLVAGTWGMVVRFFSFCYASVMFTWQQCSVRFCFWLSQTTKAQDISVFINQSWYIISNHRLCKWVLSFLAEVFYLHVFYEFLIQSCDRVSFWSWKCVLNNVNSWLLFFAIFVVFKHFVKLYNSWNYLWSTFCIYKKMVWTQE